MISWSLNISVCRSHSASGTVAEAQALQRGGSVILYTLTNPLIMLRRQRGLSSSQGELHYTHNVSSGKDDARWQVRPDPAAPRPRSPLPLRLRSALNLGLCAATRRKYQLFIQQKCTTSLSRKNRSETRYKNTSCNQSRQITVLTCERKSAESLLLTHTVCLQWTRGAHANFTSNPDDVWQVISHVGKSLFQPYVIYL